MYTILHKVDAVSDAVQIVLSKNRHVFLEEDIQTLETCLEELEKIKEEVINAGSIDNNALLRLVKIIKLLDFFFGSDGNVLDFFNDLN
jgi:hypothetical protein